MLDNFKLNFETGHSTGPGKVNVKKFWKEDDRV